MKTVGQRQIRLGGQQIDYRVKRSKVARKLRVRVGLNGVEVVQREEHTHEDVATFLTNNEAWILDQLQRVERLRRVRRLESNSNGEILFRGESTRVRVEVMETRARGNIVRFVNREIVVHRGMESQTPATRSLENWLRTQARTAIQSHLTVITERLGQHPHRVYVMGQRTKWGSCSSRRNLSFNWRLILAPDSVLNYLVTHEAVHLAIPDHSAKFWLTVQSLCPATESAKQWLRRHEAQLMVDLGEALDRSE